MTTTDFDAAFDAFLTGAQEIIDAANLLYKETLIHNKDKSRRYIRINRIDEHSKTGPTWAFIEKASGDVLKPASQNTPAKHARGNIYDDHHGLASVTWTGPAYLRG